MDYDETKDVSQESEEPANASTGSRFDAVSEQAMEPLLKLGINRRTFLAAAALGSAAAALVNKTGAGLSGLKLGPLPAFATGDTSDLNCKASDVRLVSPITIINEPCNTTDTTFVAVATAVLSNNAASTRYCIIAHLPAKTVSVGGINYTLGGADLQLTSSIAGQTLTTVTVSIPGYPVGAGNQCFGNAPTGNPDKPDCTNPPCAAISWLTPADKDTDCSTVQHSDIPPSKCRFQQVCIVGRSATLACDSNCSVPCGGVSTLKVCGSGGSGSTYVMRLWDGSTQTQTLTATAAGAEACTTFTVTSTATTTYFASVFDGVDCTKTTPPLTITASPLTATAIASTASCSGEVTYTASAANADQLVFNDGTSTTVTATTGSVARTYTPTSSSQTHTMTVVASNAAGCTTTAYATATVNPSVTIALNTPAASTCAASSAAGLTFTATPGGGSGSGYTVVFSLDATPTLTATTSYAYTYAVNLDAVNHTVGASVTDSSGCTAIATPRVVKQCVNTSVS